MKVLHVYRTYFPDTQGGLEEVIRQICSGTSNFGVENRILTTSKVVKRPEELKVGETLVLRFPENFEIASCNVSLSALRAMPELGRWADIVHYHFPWPFADVLNERLNSHAATLVTYHSDIVRQRFLLRLYAPLMGRFLNSVDRIVCTSPNYFATSTLLSKHSSKVEVIPIGIDEATYPSLSEDVLRTVKEEYGSGFFLFVGVLRYYKGLHILLEAMCEAPYRVIIVGSGPIERQLKRQALELGLTNVTFAGHVSDQVKVALIHLSRAIVFPSYLRSEAFGVTLLEGAMLGKPLISTEVGSGTSHINVHGKTGIVIAPGSAKTLRKAMVKLFEDATLANEMGRRARSRYLRHFTGEMMAKRYASLYEEVLEQSL